MYGGRHKPKESYVALGNYGIESAWFIGWRDTDISMDFYHFFLSSESTKK